MLREEGAPSPAGTMVAPLGVVGSPLVGAGWRTPAVILVCGCLIGVLGFGPRSALGFFPHADVERERLGPRRVLARARDPDAALGRRAAVRRRAWRTASARCAVLSIGAVLYALGLPRWPMPTTPGMLHLTAGVVVGFGLAGSSFTIVIGAFGKLMPPEWRTLAFGAGTAAGSFGQFLFSPLAVALIDRSAGSTRWSIFAAGRAAHYSAVARAGASPRDSRRATARARAQQQSVAQALAEAFGHRSYMLLVLGFFTCGFQIFFIAVHLPAYLVDRGLPAEIGGWTLAIIGLFNIVGAIAAGWLVRLHAQALHPVVHLFRAGAWRSSSTSCCRRARPRPWSSAPCGIVLALDRAADLGAGRS